MQIFFYPECYRIHTDENWEMVSNIIYKEYFRNTLILHNILNKISSISENIKF